MKMTVKYSAWIGLLAMVVQAQAFIYTDWAYHNDGSANDERVPGFDVPFRSGNGADLSISQPAVIYLVTAYDFAGEKKESVKMRWWNGKEERWLDAEWVGNSLITDNGRKYKPFRGQPEDGEMIMDVWRVTVPTEIMRKGSNYYVFLMQAEDPVGIRNESVLLTKMPGDTIPEKNNLGQHIIRDGNFFGKDWVVNIVE